jgi:hypothetical protein
MLKVHSTQKSKIVGICKLLTEYFLALRMPLSFSVLICNKRTLYDQRVGRPPGIPLCEVHTTGIADLLLFMQSIRPQKFCSALLSSV